MHLLTLENLKALFARRRDAEQALEHPGIIAAFEAVRARALEEIVTSAPFQRDEREDAYQRLRALALVRQEMYRAVEEHEVAQAVAERHERKHAATHG